MKCPFCKKDGYKYNGMYNYEFVDNFFYADFHMKCEECGKEWTRREKYKLVDSKNKIKLKAKSK